MTSRAGHLALTARAAALDGAGRTTHHEPRQTSVFCRPGLGLVALVRTVGRPHCSAVKVGRKLEKRAPHAAPDTGGQLRASLTVVGRPAAAARSQSAKPGTDGSSLLFGSPGYISWFVLTARSRLARGPSRPPTPGSPRTRQAPHQHRYWHVGDLVAAPPQRRHLRLSRF